MLAGQSVLVLGATGGIGRPVAIDLARAGMQVVISGRTKETLNELASEIQDAGGNPIVIPGDISQQADAERIVERAAEALGGQLDALVNVATHNKVAKLMDVDLEDWDRMFATNLRGTFVALRAAARVMAGQETGGRIVQFSSVTTLFGAPGQAVYAVTKTGLMSLMKSMALEWIKDGVRVNAVSPTTTDTPLARPWLDSDPEILPRLKRTIPRGRLCQPADCCGAVRFLLSDDSDFIVGQTLYVDGGVSITHPLIK